jgi:hypothetical protein
MSTMNISLPGLVEAEKRPLDNRDIDDAIPWC